MSCEHPAEYIYLGECLECKSIKERVRIEAVVDAARAVDAQWKRACTYDTPEILALRKALAELDGAF